MEGLKEYLNLSQLSLGTMRFFDKNLSVSEIKNLLEKAYDLGITTHHSSYEYNSYEVYAKALQKANCRNNIRHICKLSSPHFEDNEFSKDTLEERVDKQLKFLNIEQIDVLQWLVRSKPINDDARLSVLHEQLFEIEDSLADLKKKGKVKSVFSFPYSPKFANKVTDIDNVDGIISYLNTEEKEYTEFAKQYNFIAIRPLFAGKLIKNESKERSITKSLKFVREHEGIISTIVGINSIGQLEVFKNLV